MKPTTEPQHEQDLAFLRRAIAVAQRSRANGNHPFGALLVDETGAVLLEAENSVVTEQDCTGHAETNLMRKASQAYPTTVLERCTLYTSTEPCAMCSGAIHWGKVGRVVFALSEESLYAMIGSHDENETLRLPCRELFARSDRPVEVVGPLIEDEARVVHEGFWT
jgi:tRNA(Arg) A34 adenosine deaminase TadA